MAIGRKKKPTNLKKLQGTYRKDRALKDEFNPEIVIPPMPEHLSEHAQKEWKRLAPQLFANGLLSDVDMATFAAYCQYYGRWVEAEEKLKERGELIDTTPNGMEQQHAYIGIANKAMAGMLKAAGEFGFTPSSRTRVSGNNPKKTDGTDEFTTYKGAKTK